MGGAWLSVIEKPQDKPGLAVQVAVERLKKQTKHTRMMGGLIISYNLFEHGED